MPKREWKKYIISWKRETTPTSRISRHYWPIGVAVGNGATNPCLGKATWAESAELIGSVANPEARRSGAGPICKQNAYLHWDAKPWNWPLSLGLLFPSISPAKTRSEDDPKKRKPDDSALAEDLSQTLTYSVATELSRPWQLLSSFEPEAKPAITLESARYSKPGYKEPLATSHNTILIPNQELAASTLRAALGTRNDRLFK